MRVEPERMGLVPLLKRFRELPSPFQSVRTQQGVGYEPGKGPSAGNLSCGAFLLDSQHPDL